MIEIICGDKGKGKTKELLDKVNSSIKGNEGSIVFLDKSQKHMYELNNQVRLINVMDYPIDNCDEFLGFICGIISQNLIFMTDLSFRLLATLSGTFMSIFQFSLVISL
jgi:hypothetical protein